MGQSPAGRYDYQDVCIVVTTDTQETGTVWTLTRPAGGGGGGGWRRYRGGGGALRAVLNAITTSCPPASNRLVTNFYKDL